MTGAAPRSAWDPCRSFLSDGRACLCGYLARAASPVIHTGLVAGAERFPGARGKLLVGFGQGVARHRRFLGILGAKKEDAATGIGKDALKRLGRVGPGAQGGQTRTRAEQLS